MSAEHDRREAQLRTFPWRLLLCSLPELERLDEALSKIERARDAATPTEPGPAITAKLEREYRRAKSVEIDVSDLDDRDPRDVIGDGATHAPDGGES